MAGTYPVPTPCTEVFGNCSTCVATSTYGTTNPAALTNESWVMGTGYTNFPVAQQTNYPYNYFYIRDPADTSNEMCMVILGGGNTSSWSVIRGVLGTTPVAHASLATWEQVISEGTLQNFKQAPGAVSAQATITTSTTETVLATYTPVAADLTAGATWSVVAFGPVTAHGGASRSTVAFNLYWGGSGAVNGAFTLGSGKLIANLLTGTNMPAFAAVTTMIAGSSFDINGEVTWLTTVTAHANLNAWLNVAANLSTAPLVGTCADVTASGGGSGAGPVTIPNSAGPIILTAVWSSGWTVYGLTANSLIYRVT